MKDILPKHVLHCKQLQIACKLHEINTAVLEVPKQDGRSVLYKTCKHNTDLVSASNVCSVREFISSGLTVVSPLDIFLGKITGFYIHDNCIYQIQKP